MTPTDVGVVGLGRMGLPIARHLLARGWRVHGVERDAAAAEAADSAGVAMHDDAASMASMTRATIVVVGFDDEVMEVCAGRRGVVGAAGEGHALFISSTVRPRVPIEVAGRARSRGVDVFDVPLCRSEHAAVAGALLALVGGDRHRFDPWRPMFEAFATDLVHVGPVGTGQVAKALNNALLWATVVADAEVLSVGMEHGIDQEALRQALLLGSGANWALETWQRDRPMPWAADDMDIVSELANGAGVETPLSDAVSRLIADIKRRKADAGLAQSSMEAYLAASLRASPPG